MKRIGDGLVKPSLTAGDHGVRVKSWYDAQATDCKKLGDKSCSPNSGLETHVSY